MYSQHMQYPLGYEYGHCVSAGVAAVVVPVGEDARILQPPSQQASLSVQIVHPMSLHQALRYSVLRTKQTTQI